MDTILGKGKKDISMLLTFVAADNYLEDRGKLGFVITQSVFKTSGAGQGFRRFVLGSGTSVGVVGVDDLVDVQPFEGATNRTAVVVLQRGRATRYPLAYTMWRKTTSRKRVPEDATLEEVSAMSVRRRLDAQPIGAGDLTSSWMTGRRRALLAVEKVIGQGAYRAFEGSNTGGANGVYWMQLVAKRPDGMLVVSNLTEGAKRHVDSVQAAIEPDLVYPLVRGRDVNRWHVDTGAHILMAQDPVRRRGYEENWMSVRCPKTYAYLKRFEDTLRSRAAFLRYFGDGAAFYSMFNVGEYTFAPHKVVWREQANRFTAAVVPLRDRPPVPDHKLMLVPLDNEDSARYVAACLNSSPGQFVVLSYAVNIQMNTHILEHVRVPSFDAQLTEHRRLAELSKQAHAATTAGDAALVLELEAEIDRAAAELWGLTADELKEIQESLVELD